MNAVTVWIGRQRLEYPRADSALNRPVGVAEKQSFRQMNIQPMAFRRQKGAALLVLLGLLLLAGAAVLLDHFNGEASASVNNSKADGSALADAKAALIAWSATYSPSAARESTAGQVLDTDDLLGSESQAVAFAIEMGPALLTYIKEGAFRSPEQH